MECGARLRRPPPVNVDSGSSMADVDALASTPYRQLVGCLMYVAIGTRPDIAYAVNKLSSFMDCYTSVHWHAALRVVRYLKGTRDLQLVLGGDCISLAGYSDSDYANCLDTRRSVMGYSYNLGLGAISWASRKQKTVSLSSCEAEYIAVSEAGKEGTWLRQLLSGLHIALPSATRLACDNNGAVSLAGDPAFHARVKHIDVRHHHIRQLVDSGTIHLHRVSSRDNVADILTKALPPTDFRRLRAALGLR